VNWDQYLENNQFYYATLDPLQAEKIRVLSYLDHPEPQKHQTYLREYSYSGTWQEYTDSCQRISEVLSNYDTSLVDISQDQLFRCKEWGQLCAIICDIYLHGAFNISTLRLDHQQWIVHPGNHLYFARQFLGMPADCFLAISGSDTPIPPGVKINSRITKVQQIKQVLNNDDITMWIDEFSDYYVPHIYPQVHTDQSWKSYSNGDCDWPWEKVEKYNQTGIHYDPSQIQALRDYPTKRLLENNRFAFWLTGLKQDENFKRI
tara:strand:+ start:1036 stop:1818 length:783 start_codon:yes stop_codon:yes gene_type:complete